MTTSVVVAKFVNPPRGKAISGSIKTPDGTYYGVKPEMLSLFQQGETYEIEWSQNGQFKNITAAKPFIPTPANGGGAAISAVSYSSRSRTDPHDSANMWCCAVMTAMIRAHEVRLDSESLTTAELMIREAHRDAQLILLGRQRAAMPPPAVQQAQKAEAAPPKPSTQDEMDDDIPF
jgi:hypothetical protein